MIHLAPDAHPHTTSIRYRPPTEIAPREQQLARATSVPDKRWGLADESADGDGGAENGIRYAQTPIRKAFMKSGARRADMQKAGPEAGPAKRLRQQTG